MEVTEEDISTLAPDTEGAKHSYSPKETSSRSSIAWGIFCVIILTTIFFFVALVIVPTGEDFDKHGNKMRGKVDKTNYGWTLFIVLLAAIFIVFLASRFRK